MCRYGKVLKGLGCMRWDEADFFLSLHVVSLMSRQVEKEVQKELDEEKPQGEQALNDLFKSIYGKVINTVDLEDDDDDHGTFLMNEA